MFSIVRQTILGLSFFLASTSWATRLCRDAVRAVLDGTAARQGFSESEQRTLLEDAFFQLEQRGRGLQPGSRNQSRNWETLARLHFEIRRRRLTEQDWLTQPNPKTPVPTSFAREVHEVRSLIAGKTITSREVLGTRVYYVPTPNPRAGYPEVDVSTRGLVLYFGGSGTTSASGRVLAPEQTHFRQFQIAGLSFDYPFHADGPRELSLLERENATRWFVNLVKHYDAAGVPLVLVGHSFGPKVILEVLSEYQPKNLVGAVLAAPSAITRENFEYYWTLQRGNVIAQFNREHSIEMNETGDLWADSYGLELAVNPNPGLYQISSRLTFLTGDSDPWINVPLLRQATNRFLNAELDVVRGLGHYTFAETLGQSLHSYFQQKIVDQFESNGVLVENMRGTDQEEFFRIATYYELSTHFRRFVEEKRKPLQVYLKDPRAAKHLWVSWQKQFLSELRAEAQRLLDRGLSRYASDVIPYLAQPPSWDQTSLLLRFVVENSQE